MIVLDLILFSHRQKGGLLGPCQGVVIACIGCRFIPFHLIFDRTKSLFDFNALGFLKFVLLFETVISNDLVINAIVKLAIVIELVLAVNLSALFRESKDLLFDLHQLHHLRF